MTLDEINDWFDSFYEETIEAKKPVRGRTFSGARIEIWGRDSIAIVIHDPYPRGTDRDQQAQDFVRNINDENTELTAEISPSRLKEIIAGTNPLTENDWLWNDE
jgi:hypothetical protein